MKQWKRWLVACMALVMMVCSMPVAGGMKAYASEVDVYAEKITNGKTGKNMTVTFKIRSYSDIDDVHVAFDVTGGEIWDEDEEDREYGYAFPFEVTKKLPTRENPKSIGRLTDSGSGKTVSITGRVRRDLSEGYYKVPVVVFRGTDDQIGWADIQVWISKSVSGDDDDDDSNKTYDFVLGEGQSTPVGSYPNVMNFSMNLRNNSPASVYNVKASMVLDPDSEKFPFEINDANYDRMFEKIEVDETVSLDYSFAIRDDTYSGYYPVGMKIYYSDSSTGEELETYETSFYVHVFNKDKEDDMGDFNEHDRTKARLIVDGYATDPETIVAGSDFDLILNVKNASNSIGASNILLSIESEKVSDSAVFTTESGTSSIAMDSLGPGASKELRFRLQSKPGVDQRSYGVTIKAKFDSPEFKNAEESMTVDIPVKQIPRLNTGTFEIMPDTISVGEEANVMFGINNTGKVMLYNVMVLFEGGSIQKTDTYVGNIKPGETGNVDCMVTGAAPTADDGKLKVTISYEDENGEVSTVDREMTLFVTEDMSGMDDFDMEGFEDIPMEEPGFFQKHQDKLLPAALATIAVLVIIIVVMAVRHRRSRKALREDEDDEIS